MAILQLVGVLSADVPSWYVFQGLVGLAQRWLRYLLEEQPDEPATTIVSAISTIPTISHRTPLVCR